MDYFKKVTGPRIISKAKVITTPHLGEKMLEGKRGPMLRDVWPYACRIDGKRIPGDPEGNSKDMRKDYAPIGVIKEEGNLAENDLAKEILAATKVDLSRAYFILRSNIPMNLGVAWFENGKWNRHQEDILNPNSPILLIREGRLSAHAGLNDLKSDDIALLTPCYGLGYFDAEMLIKGTYDVRHLVGGDPDWKDANENNPKTIRLLNLTRNFKFPDQYCKLVKDEINKNGWGRYNRTVIVVDYDGNDPFEVYSFSDKNQKPTAPEIFQMVTRDTKIKNPVIFGLVEGGSFGFGLAREGKLLDFGETTIDYFRGCQGMWILGLEINCKAGENLVH